MTPTTRIDLLRTAMRKALAQMDTIASLGRIWSPVDPEYAGQVTAEEYDKLEVILAEIEALIKINNNDKA